MGTPETTHREKRDGRILYLLPGLLALYLGSYFLFGERVPQADGLGFDGAFYGALARDVPGVLGAKIPEYYFDRILPSVFVWLSANALGFDLSSPQRIVTAFHIYNTLLLIAAAFVWVRIARTLALSLEVSLIGATCLFVNWIVTKQYLYFSVQTDVTGFSLGVIAAFCVLTRRLFLLTIVALIASFAWKTIMPFCLLLIVFSRPAPEHRDSAWQPWIALAIATLASTAALYTVLSGFQWYGHAAQVDFLTLPLSVVLLGAYVYYVAYNTPIRSLIAGLRIGPLPPIAAFLVAWGIRLVVLWLMAKHVGNATGVLGLESFVFASLLTALLKPAVFLIAHVVSFGPGLLLLLWRLPGVLRGAASHSVGTALFLVANLAMAINSESRILAFAYPAMITFLCVELRRITVSRRFALAFLIVSLLLARFYLPLNKLGITNLQEDVGVLLRFPWQWFFMNIGHYMSWTGYFACAAMTVLTGIVLASFWRRSGRASAG